MRHSIRQPNANLREKKNQRRYLRAERLRKYVSGDMHSRSFVPKDITFSWLHEL